MTKRSNLTYNQDDLHFPILTFRNDLEHLFDDFFRRDRLSKNHSSLPKCNIFETQESYNIDVRLPGLSAKEVDLSLHDNILTIKGEHLDENKQDDKNYHLREFSSQSFQRSWELPANVDKDKLTASFESGIIKIELPKKHEEASVVKINIKE
ncbi:MAG: Hsp20/alpha crystallin family protein [Legionellaceae bacterium]|nr:Hsp20/alpha crystallin family protein [Legionellaceae bacterium]